MSWSAASISKGIFSISVDTMVVTVSTAAGMSVGSASAIPCTSVVMNCAAASTTSGKASIMPCTSVVTSEAAVFISSGSTDVNPLKSASKSPTPISRSSGRRGAIASRMPSNAFGTVFARFLTTGVMFLTTELKEFTTLSHSLSMSASASPRPVIRF